MSLIVQKYGGTSVGDLSKIRLVANKVRKAKLAGDDLVVVVSAMAGSTDDLINKGYALSSNPPSDEMDLLMSSGERISAALLAIALNDIGIKARSFTGRQIGLTTDSTHMKARIKTILATSIKSAIADGLVSIVAGFQGISEDNDRVTTLGRGGSDTSAVAIAVSLKASRCEIYTDVPGVMTTDPNLVPKARLIEKISFDEMLETASLGAKVLQTRSVEFGKKYNMPILVKSTFVEGKGTLVTDELEYMENILVTTIAYDKNQAKVTVRSLKDRPGVAAKLFSAISELEINVDMIIQNVGIEGTTDLSFTVPKDDLSKTIDGLAPVLKLLDATDVVTDEQIGKVSIIGVGMRSHTGVAAKAFRALADANINIIMISTSEIKVSCVVESSEIDRAVRILHDTFDLGLPAKDRAK
ncbi:MAG: aspartate kinase [Nitrospinota bacterium]